MSLEILVNSVSLVCGLVACFFAYVAYTKFTGSSRRLASAAEFDSSERAAAEQIDRLQKKISALTKKVELVEEHAGEYFYVLHDHGWSRVIEVVEKLEAVNADINRWIAERRFDNALAVAQFLASAGSELNDSIQELVSTELTTLQNWENEVNQIILKVATELGGAANNTKDLGISRQKKRNPTLMAVQEIMRLLGSRQDSKSNFKDW